MLKRSLIILNFIIFVSLFSQVEESIYELKYQTLTKKKRINYDILLNIKKEKSFHEISHFYNTNEKSEKIYVNDLYSLIYLLNDKKNGITINAERRQNRVFLKGIHKGKEIKKVLKIDESPWFAEIATGVRYFMKKKEKRIEFWYILHTKYEIYKMALIKTKIVNINGERVQEMIFTLADWRSIIWKAHFYVRVSDGIVYRYKGNEGPGTPKKTETLKYIRKIK